VFSLLIASIAGADFLSTAISTDGSALLATSGSDQNGSFGSRIMTLDQTRLARSVSGDEGMKTDLVAVASGPVLFSEFASGLVRLDDLRERCVFLDGSEKQQTDEASVYTSGILHGGEYDLSRTIGSGFEGITAVNGSGFLGFGSYSSGNRSLESRGFVSGNMTVQDLFRYGGKI